MKHDAQVKRAILIGKSVEVRDSFGFATPPSVLRAQEVYCTSYYGSLAGWDLAGPEATKFYNVATISIKEAWNVPRATHRYFLPVLAPSFVPARAEVLARFVRFFRSLRTAPSHEVTTAALLLARDMRSTLAKNLAYVEELTGQDPWTASPELIRQLVTRKEAVAPPPQSAWRLPYLTKLLQQRQELHYRGLKEAEEEMQELINAICIN